MRIHEFIDSFGAAWKSRVTVIVNNNYATWIQARNNFFEAYLDRFIEIAIKKRKGDAGWQIIVSQFIEPSFLNNRIRKAKLLKLVCNRVFRNA